MPFTKEIALPCVAASAAHASKVDPEQSRLAAINVAIAVEVRERSLEIAIVCFLLVRCF
jgi:hypothetical protein